MDRRTIQILQPKAFVSEMSEILIRQATTEDAQILTDLAYTTFWDAFAHHPKNAPDDLANYMRQAFSLEQIAAELADEKHIFLITEIDGETAGYAKIIIDNIEPGITATRPIELSRLYSHQKFLGQGVGQTLMDACFDRALEENRDVMWLGVWEFNPRAQRFYEKNGFRIVGSHTFLLGSDPQTDLLMQKEI
jgi:ribosomal protein S18 acetylase RimI-like enzyme